MKKILLTLTLILAGFILVGCNKEPKIELTLNQGVDTVEINTAFVDAGATATRDGETLDVAVEVSSSNVDTSTLGTYEIIYTASFESTSYSIKRYVFVVDEIAPTIVLNDGVDTIFVNQSWTDAGATVSDNSLEDLSGSIEVTGSVDITKAGQYTIQYAATDSSGNTGSMTRIVHVIGE